MMTQNVINNPDIQQYRDNMDEQFYLDPNYEHPLLLPLWGVRSIPCGVLHKKNTLGYGAVCAD